MSENLPLERIDEIRNALQTLIEENWFDEDTESYSEGWIACCTFFRSILYPDGRPMDKWPPTCACGNFTEKVADGDLTEHHVAHDIYICRKCHKIHTDGWKWG